MKPRQTVTVSGVKFTQKEVQYLAEVFGAKALRRQFNDMIEIQAITDQATVKEMLRRKP